MLELADCAGELALRHFQSDALTISIKSDDSPVTQADTAIETLLRQRIHARFPNDSILGEEQGEAAVAPSARSNWRWILDPIDGTVSFAAGVPLFGTLIALEHETTIDCPTIEAGICAMPALRERVWAARGQGAWWERVDVHGVKQRSAARVRSCATLANALLCTTGLEYFERSNSVSTLVRVAQSAGRIRGWSDCYAGMLVATGRADAWIDPVMHPWDSGPFPVIFEEAHGVFTDWSGRCDIRGGSAVAACQALHAQLMPLLRASS